MRLTLLCGALLITLAAGLAAPAHAQDDGALALRAALEEQIFAAAQDVVREDEAADLALLMRFYQARGSEPLWVTEEGATPEAFALAERLNTADMEGLDPGDYGAAAVHALLSSGLPDLLAQLELRLSRGAIEYAADLAGGRLEPRAVDPELFVYPRDLDKAALLERFADGEGVASIFQKLTPSGPAYAQLRAALAEARARAAGGEPPPVPDGDTLDPGMRDFRVIPLRARLAATGDMTEAEAAIGAGDPSFYDPALAAAVKRFQARHGLDVDGRIGKNTLAAVNRSLRGRVQTLLLNLERLRWLSGPRPDRRLEVNLADFTLSIFEGDIAVFDSRVVVGTPFNRTPVFRRDMTYLVINPYWNVPPSIAGKEMLPRIKKDPAYLTANNYEVLSGWSEDAALLDPLSIDWSTVTASAFPYKIRQKPGDGNALGRIKFMLPNEFSIYLHDTPSKALFQRSQRTFSHGCIRVARPLDLAAYLLEGQDDWTPETIQAAIDSGTRQIVSLARPLPVIIDYRTAWVDADGVVQMREDVYGRDRTLAAALLGPRSSLEAMPLQ